MVLDPASGRQGTDQVVIVRGTGIDFTEGECTARFPGGEAEVSLVRVESADRVRLLVSISPTAPEGGATLELETAAGPFAPEFTILRAAEDVSVRFAPDTVVAGQSWELWIEGTGTAFEAGVTNLSFEEDSGIAVLGLDVASPTRLHAQIDVPATTAERAYGASVSTRSQVLGAVLRVLGGSAPGLTLDPDHGLQGTTVHVRIASRNFPFGDAPVIDFPFSSGISVVGAPVVDNPSATDGLLDVDLAIDLDAPIGLTTLRVRTADGRELLGGFTIERAGETPSCTFLSSARPGDHHVPLQVAGRYTHFGFGITRAASAEPYLVVEDVVVAGPSTALLVASIQDDAPAGPVRVTFTTSTEVVICAVTVEEPPPASLTLEPNVLEHPDGDDVDLALVLRVSGLDLTEVPGTELALAAEAGSGMVVRSLSVVGPARADVVLRLSRDAPFGPSLLRLTAGATTLSTDVLVTRAAGDAPTISPGYLLLDSTAQSLVFRSTRPPFLEGGLPWVEQVRAGLPGLDLTPAPPEVEDELPLAALPGLSVPAGHLTLAAHGALPAGERTGRHLAVRVTGVGLAGPYATASPSTLGAGREHTLLLAASASAFDAATVATAPKDSGLEVLSLRVIDPQTAFLTLAVDQSAPAGSHVLRLVAAGAIVPVVVEVSAPADPPSFVTIDAVGAGATGELALSGHGTSWNRSTTAELPADDPDLVLGPPPSVVSTTAATLRVTAAAAPTHRGGHVVWIRTGLGVAPGLVWIAAPPLALEVQPGWLRAGRDETLVLSGAGLEPATAVVNADVGFDSVVVAERSTGTLSLTVRTVEDSGGTVAVLAVDPRGTGSFTPIVVPVLPAPPLARPDAILIPREPRPSDLRVHVRGLDLGSGVAARPVGADLVAGRAQVVGADEVAVQAALALDASSAERRWLVLLGETDAAALRVLPGGDPPPDLPLGRSDVVSAAPAVPALRALVPGADGLAAVRATCTDPASVTISLVAADGRTVVAQAGPGETLPHAVPGPDAPGGAAFLAVESTTPTTCTVRHESWAEYERLSHDLEPNNDPDEAEGIALGTGLAYRHLARLGEGYDVDRYVVNLPAAGRIEVLAGQPASFAARTEFVVDVTAPDGTTRTADPWDADAGGIASLLAEAAGDYDVVVRAVAGSHGPYVLSIHGPLLLSEVDLWSGGTRFVELSGPPGFSLVGWRLVHRSAAGAAVAELELSGTVPEDGLFVVAAAAGWAGAEAEWTALDAVSGAAAFALVRPDGRDGDLVGLAGATGEGGRLDPPAPTESATSLGRCLRVDTDDNAADFWRQAAPSPGAENLCEYR